MSPSTPPPAAIQNIQVGLSRRLNSYASNGSEEMTVILRSAMPAFRKLSTARCAVSGSEYKAYSAFMAASSKDLPLPPLPETSEQAADARRLSAPKLR